MKIIHVLGYSGSGKTRTISLLAKKLTAAGKRVGTIKHIHSEHFSIDERGKDTWQYMKSGSSVVIAISPSDFVVMKRRDRTKSGIEQDLAKALQIFRANKMDYLFVEGFNNNKNNNFLNNRETKLIICSSNIADAQSLLEIHTSAVCVISKALGDIRPGTALVRKVPFLKLPNDYRKVVSLIS